MNLFEGIVVCTKLYYQIFLCRDQVLTFKLFHFFIAGCQQEKTL